MIKSEFQDILPEDCKQYNELATRYLKLNPENGTEAFDLMQISWSIAQRWSELQASTAKIANMDNVDILKTDFKTWAYQRYRQAQLIHESCRVIWRQANEQALYFERQGIVK
jgi:hypothetical protein